ncbi:MAG TPA: DUF5606 domain-containing protein [Flavisolibacter sp.]|nr:DUF5606 domain-containing protein [Flavisolibacter sp.]
MDYNRIVAITGMSGLFEVVSSKSDGAIVRSLEDKSTKFVSSRVHNLSHLESIEVYTVKDNVTLADIFASMKSSKVKLPDGKDNKALKGYFEKAFPDLDFERVYSSDMKKMVKWYEVLEANNIDFTVKSAPAEEEEIVEEPVVAEKPAVKEKPAKTKEVTAKAKPETAKTATVKKAAPKKKAAEEEPAKSAKKKTAGKK